MRKHLKALDLKKIKVFPLQQRESLSSIEKLLIDADSAPPAVPEPLSAAIAGCAQKISEARVFFDRENARASLKHKFGQRS